MESHQLLGVVRALPPAAVTQLCDGLGLYPADRLELLHSCLTSTYTRTTLARFLGLENGQATPPPAAPPAAAPPLIRGPKVHRPVDSPLLARRLFA